MNTPVIYRKFKEGEIVAIFPTEAGDMSYYTCSCYQHIGQHGIADPQQLISITKPAKPEEYFDLSRELVSIGYDDLKVYKRYQYKWLEARRQKLASIGC